MLMGRLADRGVNVENYYRLNVEIGVGEFGMNEWNRLSEISTSTRMYLSQSDVQNKNISAASKLGRIWLHNIRYGRAIATGQIPDPSLPRHSWEYQSQDEPEHPSIPGAIELPAADVSASSTPPRNNQRPQNNHSPRPPSGYQRQASDDDKFLVHADEPYTYEPRLSGEANMHHHRHNNSDLAQGPMISITPPPPRPAVAPPPPPPPSARQDNNDFQNNGRPSGPPPLPPKTPLAGQARPVQSLTSTMTRPPAGVVLPYPDTDGPPPVVNVARKPEFGVR
jgi:hypothetical protein